MFESVLCAHTRLNPASLIWPLIVSLVLVSNGFAQLERFDEADIGKYAMMARDASNYKEFGLSATQLDRLLKNEAVNNTMSRFSLRNDKDAPQRFLQEVYDVLDEKQETRLHQIMFQRWMNRDDIAKGIQTFAPGSIEDLDTKSKKLEAEIAKRKKQTIANLPEGNQAQTPKLIDFLAWRWKKQTQWLEEQLGSEKTKQLIGNPVSMGYTFTTRGDPKTSGSTDMFGDPYGGGSYFGGGHQSWVQSGNVHTASVSFDPTTGKSASRYYRGRRRNGVSDRPVDIPEGLTLAAATKQLRSLEEEMRETAESFSVQIEELRGFGRRRPRVPGVDPRKGFEDARKVEEKLEVENRLQQIELEKARIIVTKLGGDPDADKKKIRAATEMFRNRGVACNRQPFISHINATAEQCDAFDKVWDQFDSKIPELSSDLEVEYHKAIRDLLDESQKKLFDQQVFRRLWYSKDCKSALELAKITVNDEQEPQVALLPKLIRETQKIMARNQSSGMRMRFLPGAARIDDREKQNEPYVVLEEEFARTLNEIVGEQAAADLLGKTMAYDREWKRPVVIPDGLTLEKAKLEYDRLAAESRKLSKERDKLMEKLEDEGGFGFDAFEVLEPSPEEQRREVLRQRTLAKYRRYVEELGGTIDR